MNLMHELRLEYLGLILFFASFGLGTPLLYLMSRAMFRAVRARRLRNPGLLVRVWWFLLGFGLVITYGANLYFVTYVWMLGVSLYTPAFLWPGYYHDLVYAYLAFCPFALACLEHMLIIRAEDNASADEAVPASG